MNITGKIIALILFLGGISTFVAYRMGAFEVAERNDQNTKKPFVPTEETTSENEVLTDSSAEVSPSSTPVRLSEPAQLKTIDPPLTEKEKFRMMSSSKSLLLSEPYPFGSAPEKLSPLRIMPGSKSGPVFKIGDFSEEKKSLHPYLDSVLKADTLKKNAPMMGGSKSLILTTPLELKTKKK